MATQKLANGTEIFLTDALGNGIMLRDGRLTLRHIACLTRFIVEDVDGTNTYVLKAGDYDRDMWVAQGAKYALFVNQYAKTNAQRFQIQPGELGTLELLMEGARPAVFDDYFDVSIGKWLSGRSRIPILVHEGSPGAILRRKYP